MFLLVSISIKTMIFVKYTYLLLLHFTYMCELSEFKTHDHNQLLCLSSLHLSILNLNVG